MSPAKFDRCVSKVGKQLKESGKKGNPFAICNSKLKGGKNKMVMHNARTKTNAKKMAMRMRSKGFNASVFKKRKGFGVSVTRRK